MSPIQRLRALIAATHRAGVALAAKLRGLEALNRRRRRELRALEAQQPITMYDAAADIGAIPANPEAVAGYVDGRYQTFEPLLKAFPHAHHVSISALGNPARCIDVEPGNPVHPKEVPAWVRKMHSLGVRRPWVYADRDEMPAVLAALAHDGIPRDQFVVWLSAPTGIPHMEPGADATQYRFAGAYDVSLCKPTAFI